MGVGDGTGSGWAAAAGQQPAVLGQWGEETLWQEPDRDRGQGSGLSPGTRGFGRKSLSIPIATRASNGNQKAVCMRRPGDGLTPRPKVVPMCVIITVSPVPNKQPGSTGGDEQHWRRQRDAMRCCLDGPSGQRTGSAKWGHTSSGGDALMVIMGTHCEEGD